MEGGSLVIRPYQPYDLETGVRLVAQLGYPATEEELQEHIQAILGDSQGALMVGAIGEQVVGLVYVGRRHSLERGDFAQVAGLVVDERYRRQGVGRALMAWAEGWARKNGLHSIFVWSNVVRAEAHRFYESMEYQAYKTSMVFSKNLGERQAPGRP